MRRQWIGIVCISIGVSMMLYPSMTEWQEDNRQKEILDAWKQEIYSIDENDAIENTEQTAPMIDGEQVIGVLCIPDIELEQPILKGATDENLNVSLATIEPTGVPGANSNFAIAGHNSRTYGRHFNRLSELRAGDEITVTTKETCYRYEAVSSYVVEPDEVWVLESSSQKAEITLITCYYPSEGDTKRLVIRGLLKE